MPSKLLVASFVLFLGCGISSCAGLYIPNRPPTPLLHHAEEINGSIGTNNYGFDAQGAYALTKHIGLLGALSILPTYPNTLSQANFTGSFFELGAGYFDSIGDLGHVEAYGTLGYGTSSGNIPENGQFGFALQTGPGYTATPYGYNRFVDCKFFRQTLQANMGLEGKIAAVGIGLRESIVDMFQWHQLDQPTTSSGPPSEVRATKFGIFAEPVFFARLGYKWIKLYYELWVTLPVTRYSDTWTSGNTAVGLVFDF